MKTSRISERGAARPAMIGAATAGLVVLGTGALLLAAHNGTDPASSALSHRPSASASPTMSAEQSAAAAALRKVPLHGHPTTVIAPKTSTTQAPTLPSHAAANADGTPRVLPSEVVDAATQFVDLQNSFTSNDAGPYHWVNDASSLMTRGFYQAQIGDPSTFHEDFSIPAGAHSALWRIVRAHHGSQQASITGVYLDETQKATNTSTHYSLIVTYTVKASGFTYPASVKDPSGAHTVVLNMVRVKAPKPATLPGHKAPAQTSPYVWQVSYLHDRVGAPSDYGHIATAPTGSAGAAASPAPSQSAN